MEFYRHFTTDSNSFIKHFLVHPLPQYLSQNEEYNWIRTIEFALKEFFRYFEVRGRAKNTHKAYKTASNTFKNWLKDNNLNFLTLRPKNIDNLIYFLKKVKFNRETKAKGLSVRSINSALSFLSKFYTFLNYRDIPIINPVIPEMHRLKVKKSEWQRKKGPRGVELVAAINKLISKINHPRDKALFLFLKSSGGRINEILKANENDLKISYKKDKNGKIIPGYGALNTINEKADEEITLYINQESCNAYLLYIEEKQKKHYREPALFLNKDEKRISDRGVEKRLDYLCKKFNLPKLCPHDFRRAFAQEKKQLGIPIEKISKLMHHKKIPTTEIYLDEK